MKWKGITIGAAATAAVVVPLTFAITSNMNAYETNPQALTVASTAPVTSLSIFKLPNQEVNNEVMGLFTSTLLKPRPAGPENGGLETALKIDKASFNIVQKQGSNGFSGVRSATQTITDSFNEEDADAVKSNDGVNQLQSFVHTAVPEVKPGRDYGLDVLTYDLADRFMVTQYPDGSGIASYHVREEAKYWNGDRVVAEDFIEVFKRALNRENAVPWAWVLDTQFHIRNARNILEAQDKEGMTFEQAWNKYPLGVVATNPIEEPIDEIFETDYAKTYYSSRGIKPHSQINVLVDNDPTGFAYRFAADALFAPIQVPFLEKVGFEKYGTSIDTIMGCGPYRLEYADLDYKLVSNKWFGYWDASHVISPQIIMRILPNTTTQIELFRKGVIGKVSFPPQLLPQFISDPELKSLVRPSNFSAGTSDLRFNTTLTAPSSKWILDEDFRKAIMYSINRQQYVIANGANSSYPAEIESPVMNMQTAGASPYDNMGNNTGFGQDVRTIYNEMHVLGASGANDETIDMVTRTETDISSPSNLKNNTDDHLHRTDLAKRYFNRFKANHPDFDEVELKFIIAAGEDQDKNQTIVQDIEQTLPGVKVALIPKPAMITEQYMSTMDNWDMKIVGWSQDYYDPWTFYHLTFDKVNRDESQFDDLSKNRLSRNSGGTGFSQLDYIAMKLQQDKNYFKDNMGIENETLAQLIRMVMTIKSDDPNTFGMRSVYNENKVYQIPSEDNNYEGYQGTFDKWVPTFADNPDIDPTQWLDVLTGFVRDHQFVANLDPNAVGKDMWTDSIYRSREVYPAVEKIIRDSAISTPLIHLLAQYVASRMIGQVLYSYQIMNYQYQYMANKIPDSPFSLPGEEALKVA